MDMAASLPAGRPRATARAPRRHGRAGGGRPS